jgi:succinate dehydrogenase / fumarate reductase membrane anchor subunit
MRFMGSGRSGAFEWLAQRVTGVALVVILAVHFILLHYTGGGPVTYDTVAPRLADPYYKALQLLFLVMGLYHAMNGVKLLIDDYVHAPGWRAFFTGLNWVLAIAFLIFGAITVLTFEYQAV